jgi:uncharacterized membrane protein YqiK
MVKAEAEKKAALDQAEAQLTEARAEAERIRLVAEADQKRLEVDAYGQRAINEAKNLLSSDIIQFELRKTITELAPQIVAAMVKPMEKIDSIKVIQAAGFGGLGASNGANQPSSSSEGNLPNQLMQAALGYRMNLPVVDALLKEIGLKVSGPDGALTPLTEALNATSASSESGTTSVIEPAGEP